MASMRQLGYYAINDPDYPNLRILSINTNHYCHHPVGNSGSIVSATRWWEEVILEYSDVIIMHLSGHSHQDAFHLYLDPFTYEARAINYVAPSATSNYYVNPSFRIYFLDSTTYELLNFENYYMQLNFQKPGLWGHEDIHIFCLLRIHNSGIGIIDDLILSDSDTAVWVLEYDGGWDSC
ncbi:hypothetical protein LSH36_278g06059 [Paralvinella palmiformis]|uniref:Calcineurin-like phosphoesterase domain-containing protein n=1 Tax=Paralvinella palmiformis TaxID=53620 RepID=A0AAD9JJX4_9ANNE|nr:hypothetical protein LSH36_278g06059 [Paralvinella palmiformis]